MSDKVLIELTIDAALAGEARKSGADLSRILERALRDEQRKQTATEWFENNKAAVNAYNAFIEQNGVLSNDWRTY